MNWFEGYGTQLAQGTLMTIAVSVGAFILGLILSIIGAAGELSSRRLIRLVTFAITASIRGVPELLILFGIYFGVGALLSFLVGHDLQINAFIAGIFGLGIIFAAYGAQTIRGAFLSIPLGQKQSAQALGIPPLRTFSHILLPQALRYALPGLGNLWLILLKDSALISLLGLSDLMNKAQMAASNTHQPFKFYMIAAMVFLFLTTLSQFSFKNLLKKTWL